MISEIQTIIQKILPIKIDEASWNAPTLHFHGIDWSFWTLSAWRISLKNRFVCGSDDENNPDIERILTGSSIESISAQSANFPVDPVFYFSDGHVLEIFSDASYDTWTFHLPGDVVYDFISEGGAMLKTKKLGVFEEIASFLPLTIDDLIIEDDRLILLGNNWKFSVQATWRIHSLADLNGKHEPNGPQGLPDLKNCSVQSIQIQSDLLQVDPVLFLSNNFRLEVFSASCNQSWFLELPNGEKISGFI